MPSLSTDSSKENQRLSEKRHPKGLYMLFATEMWERFSFYGMRALLVLYLVSRIEQGGFGLTREAALEIYAIFTGLVYLTPIIGGLLADKLLGQRTAILIGGILMAMGQFILASSELAQAMSDRTYLLYLGLGVLIIGNGFFKPNISTLVGKLYSDHDPRKDSAFTIFYMGINLGAFLAPLICGYLAYELNWAFGFSAAGVGMILGTVWFLAEGSLLGSIGFAPSKEQLQNKHVSILSQDWKNILIYVLGSAMAVLVALKFWDSTTNYHPEIKIASGILGAGILLYVISKNTKGTLAWKRVSVILILCIFNIFFWAGFEQAGGTFNLFAEQNTNRNFVFFDTIAKIPASWFQSINSIWIILLAPIISIVWVRLSAIRKNPNIPLKFAIGLLLLGVGFVVMNWANQAALGDNLVSPMWLISVYFLHTVAELCLSPIGLSMVSKLSPPSIVSVTMGLWFASIALANYMAGILEGILHRHLPEVTLFNFLSLSSIGAAVLLFCISPLLKKMMGGVR